MILMQVGEAIVKTGEVLSTGNPYAVLGLIAIAELVVVALVCWMFSRVLWAISEKNSMTHKDIVEACERGHAEVAASVVAAMDRHTEADRVAMRDLAKSQEGLTVALNRQSTWFQARGGPETGG